MAGSAVFTVDLEDWHHGLHIDSGGHTSWGAAVWLFETLSHAKVHAIVYELGRARKEWWWNGLSCYQKHHVWKSHGYWHDRGEKADRQPYAYLGLTGGFWFRLLPYFWIKRNVIKAGHYYCHPHDFDEDHPRLKNPIMNWKRHVGLRGARKKLLRLLREVEWTSPNG